MRQQLPCDAFRKNPDGTWACIKPVRFTGLTEQMDITPGATFRRGMKFKGIDLATLLDANCM